MIDIPIGTRLRSLQSTKVRDLTAITTPSGSDTTGASEMVEASLDAPIQSPTIDELAAGKESACIVICDITRPVPNGALLRPIVRRLMDAGIALEQITILVATGLHRPNEGEELAALIGDDWVLENVRIVNHDATNDADHVDLGFTTGRHVPVRIDRHFVDADVKIVTGLVEPHFMAGWSGGRKVIAPGIAHHSTIRTFHSARFMEHPNARACVLRGNPLHEEQLEIAGLIQGPITSVNVVLDSHRNVTACTFGDLVASHAAAIDLASDTSTVSVPRRYSTVVTSAGGFPLDQTYYQTIKAMVSPLQIVEPGGDLIVVSDCSEGLGSTEFRDAQERLVASGPEDFIASLQAKDFADIDEWQSEKLVHSLRHCNLTLFAPGLAEADHKLTGVAYTNDLDGAIDASVLRHGDPAVAVVVDGPYIVPAFAPTAPA